MFELTYDEIMELKYEARHGDEWAQIVPSPMTFDEAIEYKQEQVYFDTLYWITVFADDYYGADGRYNYPQYEF